MSLQKVKRKWDVRCAATLMEIVVVSAIVICLSTILLGVVSQAKKRAWHAATISNLRSLGQAAALYREANGEYPYSVDSLVVLKMIPHEICVSPLDGFERGLANELYAQLWSRKWWSKSQGGFTNYRQSYISYATFNFTNYHRRLFEQSENGGWLVDYLPGSPEVDYTLVRFIGKYRRLTFDGAVILRSHRDIVGRTTLGQPSILKFGDFSHDQEISILERGRL